MRLPNHVCGEDTDDLLAYCTPKIAYIRDRNVGAAFYCLVSLALCWVIVGQMLWRNEHFMLKDVKGITRMWITHPTKNQCDPNGADCEAAFVPLSKLPYCNQHDGGPKVKHATDCIYADKHSMFQDGAIGQQMFIPTSRVEIEEVKHCDPRPENAYACEGEYRKEGGSAEGYYLNETRMKYFANVEDYMIQLTSTYHRGGIVGTALDHPGHFLECFSQDKKDRYKKVMSWKDRLSSRHVKCADERRIALECMPGAECTKERGMKTMEESLGVMQTKKDEVVRETEEGMSGVQILGAGASGKALRALHHRRQSSLASSAASQPSNAQPPDAYATEYGDTFKLGKMLQLAGINLDQHTNMKGTTTRMTGSVLEIEVGYGNLVKFLSSFGFSRVYYTYSMKERMLPYVSKEYLAPTQPDDYPLRRRYVVEHGIMINFVVGGEFGVFNIVYLLIMLTTALALLGSAAKVTDLVAIYLHPRRRNYFHLKYDVSPDFSDMWECKKCGYLNTHRDSSCKGLEKYECEIDHLMCGCTEPTPQTAKFKKAQ